MKAERLKPRDTRQDVLASLDGAEKASRSRKLDILVYLVVRRGTLFQTHQQGSVNGHGARTRN